MCPSVRAACPFSWESRAWTLGSRGVTVATMTLLIIAFAPWLAGALAGAIAAGVLNRHQTAWYDAIVHCVGGTFVGAGIAAWFFRPIIIVAANLAYVDLLVFWVTVPVLFGSVAALIATRPRR